MYLWPFPTPATTCLSQKFHSTEILTLLIYSKEQNYAIIIPTVL